MLTVQDLLQMKGSAIWSISPTKTIMEALNLLAAKEIGALLVIEQNRIEGILSERDIVRQIAKKGCFTPQDRVKDLMSAPVYKITPEKTIEQCMALMTEKHIRHLPVVKDDQLLGILSIGDVVKAMLSDKDGLIESLENYISGTGYGH